MLSRTRIIFFTLLVIAITHAAFAWMNRDRRPELTVLDTPPSPLVRETLAFGDHELLYRYWALDLQNAGDTAGRVTRMSAYNYDNVIGWLVTLQSLDARAQQHTFLAAHYFTQSQNPAQVRRALNFLISDVKRDPEEKWFWLMDAVATADRTLKDTPLALEISLQLAAYDYPGMPAWVWVFPATMLEKLGRYDEARAFIARVRSDKAGRLETETLHWMDELEKRLPRL